MSKKFQKGFTLVELSIVIVIIGLIVAGITAGQALVRQAQLRSLISEHSKILGAMNAFRLEYDAIPGDFDDADQYWAVGCNAAATGASVAAECNGDADGTILAAAGNTGETYTAWLHLNFADLFPGPFIPGAVLAGTIGQNIPASKFAGAGITLVFDDATSDATAGDGAAAGGRDIEQNIVLFGGNVAGALANGTIFSAPQVQSIDDKADDGDPLTGTVRAVGPAGGGAADCVDTGATPNEYNRDSTNESPCAIAMTM